MKITPLIFTAPMVRALLDGRKTQTRRIVKDQKGLGFISGHADESPGNSADIFLKWLAPVDDDGRTQTERWVAFNADYPEEGCLPLGHHYGKPGDLIWVRETWALIGSDAAIDSAFLRKCEHPRSQFADSLIYRADCDGYDEAVQDWRSARFMFRWASRLTLRLTDVRVQRVQEISEDDARAEGSDCRSDLAWGVGDGSDLPTAAVAHGHRAGFQEIWKSIHGPDAWNRNDWVWALTFDVIKANVDKVLEEKAA